MTYRSSTGQSIVHAQYRELLADWPVPSEQRLIDTRQGPTFVVSSGPAGAPPLILLHGSAGTTLDWSNDVPAWSKTFRVHAIDTISEPGLSASPRPELGSPAYAEWLDDVLDGLGVERFSVVGFSLGAWFALDYATRRPGRVQRLALLSPAGLSRMKVLPILPALLLRPFGEWGHRRSVATIIGPLPEGLDWDNLGFALLVQKHFAARTGAMPTFTDEQLENLDLLAIVGSKDRMFDAAGTARRLPGRSVTIEGAGHLLPPQTERVLEFLR
ncbi:alpha/beta fold hydrolase [Kribbella italica]|uniref:Pimeloyl-ACP methyl ester carboxylesterase n=1 Tax=Kribbella italica TaxID=1540520 RepID=A0A7W9MSK6_9ACTN|nr:alpha/beta hydrolase [Kribbella italica]MBB5834272.1 pimeloyl-ACP methyl ester carboxylesterase [Kribbella italica]